MNLFHEMLRKTTSSPYYDQMMRFVAPLNDHFGVNHFWYYRVTYTGQYVFLGTHSAWNEYSYDHHLIDHFPCLRHPGTLQTGINLMKKTSNASYKNVLKTAWEKFNINFNIQLLTKISEGVEGFGFATRYNHRSVDEKLLNDLGILRHFIKLFRERHKSLFHLLYDNPIDLASYLGPLFTESQSKKILFIPHERDIFLRKIGFEAIFTLTKREKDILKFTSNGYPASYIAEELKLRERTVENYITTIKSKLSCNSKVELIQKSQELASIGYFEHHAQ